MTGDLRALANWLIEQGVTHVAMESTGVYWKAVWNILAPNYDRRVDPKEKQDNLAARINHDGPRIRAELGNGIDGHIISARMAGHRCAWFAVRWQ